jgi:hypothetical protein
MIDYRWIVGVIVVAFIFVLILANSTAPSGLGEPSTLWSTVDTGNEFATYKMSIPEGSLYLTLVGDRNTRASSMGLVFVPRST